MRTSCRRLTAALELLPDPRDRRGRRYRLPSLITIVLCAVAAGVRSYSSITDWTLGAPREVLSRFGIRFRVPSGATIRQVLGRVGRDGFDRVLGHHLATAERSEFDVGPLW